MGITKTIGGERLGAGKKMQTELRNYERSTHNLDYIWRSSMAPGTLVPFMVQVALPGDTFDIDLNADVKTHPTVGPLFGSFKLQLDVFKCPIRLYHKTLHNNKLNVGMNMSQILLPTAAITGLNIDASKTTPVDLQHINPSSLLSYLGIKGAGSRRETQTYIQKNINALPILMYWDIFKNYYANKQEENAYVIHSEPPIMTDAGFTLGTESETIYPTFTNDLPIGDGRLIVTGTNLNTELIFVKVMDVWFQASSIFQTKIDYNNEHNDIEFSNLHPEAALLENEIIQEVMIDPNSSQLYTGLHAFPLENIDTMRDNILSHDPATAFSLLNESYRLEPYILQFDPQDEEDHPYEMFALLPLEGLAVKTYQSDMFNNYINTDYIDGVNGIAAVTAVAIVDDKFTIDTLNLSKKVYDMLNRIAVSGASYEDWVEAVYSHMSNWRAETPIYCGGLSKEIVFQEVVSTAEATTENPLGSLAGKGIMSNKHKGGSLTIKIDEPSYIMGIVSITPRIDYSQGNDWHVDLATLDDLHKPALDGIGFEDLVTERMAFWDIEKNPIGQTIKRSAGKLPAWINYMTNFNRNFGNFADPRNEMFMTLNRRYTYNSITRRIKDLTTYIDPSKFNYAFAQTDISAQNFWVQIASDITARRKMSTKIIPNL